LAYSIDKLQIGDSAEFSKTVTEADIYGFASITGDFNPIHIDESYAQKSIFKSPIAHGILSAGFISAVIGNKLPGPGTVYLKQELNFRFPIHIGDTITARVEIIDVDVAAQVVTLLTTCRNQNEVVVLDGQALVKLPRSSPK